VSKETRKPLVAVHLYPAEGRVRETEFHRADHWYTGKGGHIVIEYQGECVATYDKNAVKAVRHSKAKLRTSKVTFVRRFVTAPGFTTLAAFDRSDLGADIASPGQ
jgi:hypothetical protein